MAAPSGVVWGSTVGSYGRIGLYINVTTNNATTYAGDVQVWFWSKYSVSDTSNTLYFDNLSASGSATTSKGALSVKTTIASGSGWSTTNQVKLASYSFSYTKGTSAVTRYLYSKLVNIDRVGGTMYVSGTLSIPQLASYTVTYNLNGGSGSFAKQTKYHGKSLILHKEKPTRNGYSFLGWALSEGGAKYYNAGAQCDRNENLSLWAVWQPNTYTVTYNANGGNLGNVANQTKTHDVALTLDADTPTRTNYNFLGWATSASATTAAYAAGGSYTTNAPVTLYAVWELAYIKPVIYNLVASRCDTNGTEKDDGLCGLIKFDWKITNTVTLSKIIITWTSSVGSGSKEITPSGTSGSASEIIGGDLSADASYSITVEVIDNIDSNKATTTLNGTALPIDAIHTDEGVGVSFGKPAEYAGMAEFALDAKFNKPVYGKVTGLDRLPYIPNGSNLNDYITTGCWAIYSNSSDTQPSRADTIYCGEKLLGADDTVPPARAGRLEVISATGEGVRSKQWSYLRQRYIPYNSSNAVWERDIARGADNIWHYYEWWKSSLTPAASEKVYSKAAITLRLSGNVTLGALNTYTKIPFDAVAHSTSSRLTLSENAVRIGSNISYIKASGQTLIKCGSLTGGRHARIQKVSSGVTTSYAWDCITATATSNTLFPFTPVIIPVEEGDLIIMVYYTGDTADSNVSGSVANGAQSYLTVEEL